MKKVWARVGMDIYLTDDQYSRLAKEDVSDVLWEAIKKGEYIVSGESYLPSRDNVGKDYDNFDDEV